MTGRPMLDLTVTVDQRAIDRAVKRLDKLHGKPLEQRVSKAFQQGLTLLVAPIRAGAARYRVTGASERSVGVKKLRRRPGELVAYKVGVEAVGSKATRSWWAHFMISGTRRGITSDPYVDEAIDANRETVDRFITEQVTKVTG